MEYQIAIPSYRRAELLQKATLATLERLKVEPERITIWVANESEEADYRAVLGSKYRISIGVLGLVQQRRFYHQQYERDTRLIEICDDVFDIKIASGKSLVPYADTLDKIAEVGFGVSEKVGARMWGINPVSNPFFMDNTISVGLRLIYGTFFGSYAGDPVFTDSRISESSSAEDFENSLKSFVTYGSVVRIDNLTPISKLFTTPGGILSMLAETSGNTRMQEHEVHLNQIVETYSDLATLYRKAGDVLNIRLKRVTHAKIPSSV
jgi:hypothetical protein